MPDSEVGGFFVQNPALKLACDVTHVPGRLFVMRWGSCVCIVFFSFSFLRKERFFQRSTGYFFRSFVSETLVVDLQPGERNPCSGRHKKI